MLAAEMHCLNSLITLMLFCVYYIQANHLFKCLMSAELSGVDYVEDVLRELEKEIDVVQHMAKQNHKVAKVCI